LSKELSDLVYEWDPGFEAEFKLRGIVDETIRDGLQMPNAPHLTLEDKCELLGHMEKTGVSDVILAMISGNDSATRQLAAHCAKQAFRMDTWILTRCNEQDLTTLIDLRRATGLDFGLNLFISLSNIRNSAEGWNIEETEQRLLRAIQMGRPHFPKIRVALEDATRTEPRRLTSVINKLCSAGVTRIAIADTAGAATCEGVKNLFLSISDTCPGIETGPALEWHGHNDRGISVATAMQSVRSGARYVHGTILGIGERNGNMPLDVFLMNLSSAQPDRFPYNWEALIEYHERAQDILGIRTEQSYPFFGDNSFASATGTHLAAMEKAASSQRHSIAKHLFSPPSYINSQRDGTFLISPITGKRGIAGALRQRGIRADQNLVEALQTLTQKLNRTLMDNEIEQVIQSNTGRAE
jgi:2-isopropylmalate synthase